MKNLSNKQLVLIKKSIGLGSAVICLLLMLFNAIKYTSVSSFSGGSDSITWSDNVSLYSFLFNKDVVVLDSKVMYLREIFAFSHVIMWISFCLSFIALALLIYGMFSKKSLFSKIGSVVLVVAFASLILISFDIYSFSRTTKYLSIFTPFYLIALLLSVVGLFSTITIKEKQIIEKSKKIL